MDVVAQSLIYFSGQSCYDAFEKAANQIASMYEQGPGSDGMTLLFPFLSHAKYVVDVAWSQLNTDFKTCSPMQDNKDLAILLSDLMGN